MARPWSAVYRRRSSTAPLALLALALLAPAACKKDKDAAAPAEAPAALVPRPAAVDASKLVAPKLFAHIPADTPYLMASFEPMPLEYFSKLHALLTPVFSRALDVLRDAGPEAEATRRWVDAIGGELSGKLDGKGLASLGVSATARYALYGHGALPVVMRVELADSKAALATVERIAAKAGAQLPPLEQRHGRSFWRIELPDDMGAIVSLDANELVGAFGPRAAIAAALPQILGAEPPAASMADGKQLKDLIARHGLGGAFIGFVDTKRLTSALIALAGVTPPPACTAELDAIAASVPRFVMSYTEFSAKRMAGAMVLELAPALARDLAAARVEMAGYDAAFSGAPLFALGAGIDLGRATALIGRAAGAVQRVGEACAAEDLARSAAGLRDRVAAPLPGPVAQLTSVAAAVEKLELPAGGGMPTALDAVLVVGARDGKRALEAITSSMPVPDSLDIPTDGTLRALDSAKLGVPFALHAGAGPKAVAVAVGAGGQKRGAGALTARAGGPGAAKTPMAAFAMDYGRFFQLQAQLSRTGVAAADDLQRELADAMAKLFGQTRFTVDATDAGLVSWFTMDIK